MSLKELWVSTCTSGIGVVVRHGEVIIILMPGIAECPDGRKEVWVVRLCDGIPIAWQISLWYHIPGVGDDSPCRHSNPTTLEWYSIPRRAIETRPLADKERFSAEE
jgi:hypothetical protein